MSGDGTRGIHLTIDFCFKEGGQLTGVKTLNESQNTCALESRSGTYSYGNDTITFGSGVFQHAKLSGLEGEMYLSHFGSLRTAGMHVFCTGISPFVHTITIKLRSA